MQVVLQGSLQHFSPPELLAFLCSRPQNGTLDLETSGKRARIFFEKDHVIWAESSAANDVTEAVIDVLQWDSGNFSLLDSAVIPDGVKPLTLTLPPLIEEANKRIEAVSGFPDSAMFRVVDAPVLQQHVSLTGEELKLLFRLAAPRSFKDLVVELAVPRNQVAERVRHLQKLGLVTTVAPEEVEEADAREPTAPHLKMGVPKRTMVGSLTPDGAPDTVYPLLEAECTIGRSPGNAITIPDASVSSTHARLIRTPEGFHLEDLKSRNGTFVNGEKVTEKRLLSDGDLIRVGKIIMTFNIARESRPVVTTQGETPIG